MTTLCVFRANDYGNGQQGFLDAMADGAVYDVDVDTGDCSYNNMYNVTRVVDTIAQCMGLNVGDLAIGAYRKTVTEDKVSYEFVTIAEMDGSAEFDDSYVNLEDGFNKAIEARGKSFSFIELALAMLRGQKLSVDTISQYTVEQLVNIGKNLSSTQQGYQYNSDKAKWTKPDSFNGLVAEVDINNGMPLLA